MFILCAVLLVSGIRRFFKGKDTVPPVIRLDHREDYVVMPWQDYEEEGFSASDDRDGDLTGQVSRTVMEDRICYKVSDSAGNESVLYRDIPYDTSYKEKTGRDFPEINIDDPDARGKIVYLTFDDGPSSYTEELLETLDRYGVQVTFFVTGAFPAYEDMIKKEDAAGNSVGIHTLTHDFEKIYSDDKAFWKDIDQMQEIVQRQTGHTTNLMRFAGGSSNSISANYTPGIMTLLTEQAQPEQFLHKYERMNAQLGKRQFVVPYLMSSHPGCTLDDAIALAEYLKKTGHRPQQVQDFYPTPGTVSTCMYHTGLDPRTMEPVYVPKTVQEKTMQRALMQFFLPSNFNTVRKALQIAHREDLIGTDRRSLVPPERSAESRKMPKKNAKPAKKSVDKRRRNG